jgi:hypothetical protein
VNVPPVVAAFGGRHRFLNKFCGKSHQIHAVCVDFAVVKGTFF